MCETLDIDADLLRFPSNGFTIESLEQNTRTKRAKRIVQTIVKGVCDHVCPGNTRFKMKMTNQPSHNLARSSGG